MNAPLPAATLLMLALDSLGTNGPYQQRRTPASAEADAGLVESIRIMGVLQPILVRWDDEARQHQVVDGHRRVTAARAAGFETIRALPVETDERTSLAAGVAANLQRAALAPVDQWRALVHLQEMGWTLDGAAGALGIAKRTAKQLDKLGRLHPSMLSAIEQHDMPEEEEIAIIAGAPIEVQEAALKNPNAWDDDYSEDGTGTVMKVPNWYDIAGLCRVRRIPQSRAIFDVEKADEIRWDEDMFAQPDDADRFTTTDIEGFIAAQNAALVSRAKRGKLRAVEWDAKENAPRLPAGWKRCFDIKTPGAMRFAAVNPGGYSLGVIVELYAVPPPEPAGGAKAAAGSSTTAPKKITARSQAVDDTAPDDAELVHPDGGDDAEDEGDDFEAAPAPAAKPGRGPLTEKGRILVAQAKTTAIRCALRDRRDHTPGDLLMVLVLALCGDNVDVRGDPASKYTRTSFVDLAARMVAKDGTVDPDLGLGAVMAIAAEAAARMIVCAPTGAFGNTSGAAAEWIGAALRADRDMPRLDTPEILATATGDTLRAVAREAGLPVGGSSKALRDRLAGHAETMELPGSTLTAPGPPRAKAVPKGHVGPFPCAGCSDAEACIRDVVCIRTEDGNGE
ncbi:ParB/RepB/Spo0J family partition protein [Neoroseomonas lacus]|uniref:Peptide transporter n=1 Tax=Neoroseomonas lacus TaxID=287609 RepID=A0A917NPX3_9PROT|nr:ParB/RepB/Spo0J family partition protein [Neoroseomonas lacus]GGJ13991.1 peptide transporter [Neoroseomonas lacus]